MQTTFAHISRDNRFTFYFLLASDPSATFFADPSTRPFPFLLEFDNWKTFFADSPCAFFSSGDYCTALSDDFNTI